MPKASGIGGTKKAMNFVRAGKSAAILYGILYLVSPGFVPTPSSPCRLWVLEKSESYSCLSVGGAEGVGRFAGAGYATVEGALVSALSLNLIAVPKAIRTANQ